MGLNEFAGYGAVALAAFASGYLASIYGLRPVPFYLGIGFAMFGLVLSLFFVKDTTGHAREEARVQSRGGKVGAPPFCEIFAVTSYRNPTLFSVSQAGLINNLNDGAAWGLFPLFFASQGLGVRSIGVLASTYPAVWGLSQLATGALSDRFNAEPGRRSDGTFLAMDNWGSTSWSRDGARLSNSASRHRRRYRARLAGFGCGSLSIVA